MAPLRTIGHGTLLASAFADLVRAADVDMIVDVRRYPGSRRHPHFSREAMSEWLPDHGIAYTWLPALGGRRKAAADSPNVALRNQQFRAYADYMATDEFAGGVHELFAHAEPARCVAVMCAESLWWRCHRRLLADHLVLCAATDVEHVFHNGRTEPHRPLDAATVVGGHLVYPPAGAQETLWGGAREDSSPT